MKTGAPAQHNQPSRKGKRAWRKNVDIQDVEHAMEGMRAEERVTGTTLQKLPDNDLFQIDTQGDTKTRSSLQKKFTLTSTKILAQRSAVPAVFSRSKPKQSLTPSEKARLLRISKRPLKGPLNSYIDPTQSGSALGELTEAVKHSGAYDPWASAHKPSIKPPPKPPTKSILSSLPAVPLPHQGTSYNPPVDAHQALLHLAHLAEEKRTRKAEKGADVKQKISTARAANLPHQGVPPGMLVDTIAADAVEEEQADDDDHKIPIKRVPPRKTTAQRNKAARLLAEKRTRTQTTLTKRLLSSIPSSTHFRKLHAKQALLRSQLRAVKRAAALDRLQRSGLAGTKLGKHRVPEERVDVQLGEDLTESLRALKVEGNLFRERFRRLQQRGAVEPRVPVLPKKRRTRTVEYEKHAWKRFE